ncbi:hypothetical protein ABTX35_01460 [Streptomyces sp. NPDC096080]|uniref:hypothetical protein n=1 Tax=Streptomyces sp. NPDC096080 TaxID=3156693 RepID=UPI00331D97F9
MVTKEPAGEPERASRLVLLFLEAVFVVVAVAGLALWSVPGALVAAGVLGALACERASADRRAAVSPAGGEGGER